MVWLCFFFIFYESTRLSFFQVFCSTFCSSRHADAGDTDADVVHGKSATKQVQLTINITLQVYKNWLMENPVPSSGFHRS